MFWLPCENNTNFVTVITNSFFAFWAVQSFCFCFYTIPDRNNHFFAFWAVQSFCFCFYTIPDRNNHFFVSHHKKISTQWKSGNNHKLTLATTFLFCTIWVLMLLVKATNGKMSKSTTHLFIQIFLLFLNNLAISQVLVFVILIFFCVLLSGETKINNNKGWGECTETTSTQQSKLKIQKANLFVLCKKPWKELISLILLCKKICEIVHATLFILLFFLLFLFLMQAIKWHSGTTKTKKKTQMTLLRVCSLFCLLKSQTQHLIFGNFAESSSKFFFGFVKKLSSTNENILLAWMKNNQHNVVSLQLLSHFQSSVLSLTCHSFCDTFNLKS